MPHRFGPAVPRERQTLHFSEDSLAAYLEWATEGSALTASARVADPAGRIALIQNAWTDGWFLPGGSVERGEGPAEAARREVCEETGLGADVRDPILVVDQSFRSQVDGTERFTAEFVVYDARADGEIPPPEELGTGDDEILAARWFESVPADLHDGEILRPYL